MAVEDSGYEIAENAIAESEVAEKRPGQSRRSFLVKMGLGAAALALVASPLGMINRIRGGQQNRGNQQFPAEDSIFHPASDPRKDPRRRS